MATEEATMAAIITAWKDFMVDWLFLLFTAAVLSVSAQLD
jgi:hypothetical protein